MKRQVSQIFYINFSTINKSFNILAKRVFKIFRIDINYKLDNIFLSLISVSEETGKLADVLNNLSKYYEDKINISSKIKSSMSYPILLSTFLIKNQILD